MAEFLIKAIDYQNTDAAKDLRGSFKRGDVVAVQPDGHQWGREEHPRTTTHIPAKFVVVKVPGLSVADSKVYLKPVEADTGLFDLDGNRIYRRKIRRRYRLRAETAPPEMLQALRSQGEITVSLAVFNTYLMSKG